MFNNMEDQGEAKDYSIRYMSWCQIFNALQEDHAKVNIAEVSTTTTTTIYPLRHSQQRLGLQVSGKQDSSH